MPTPNHIVKHFEEFARHPLARKEPVGGALGMQNSDIVEYLNGRPVRLDEALQDGDALVTLADGSHTTMKWNDLRPWPTLEAL